MICISVFPHPHSRPAAGANGLRQLFNLMTVLHTKFFNISENVYNINTDGYKIFNNAFKRY